MAISVNKVAPSAAVLAFVGYCAWPSISALVSPPPPPPPAPKVATLATSLFSPTLPPVPTRNPWGGLAAEALAAARALAKDKSKAVEEELTTEGKGDETIVPSDPLSELILEATCILGNQRVAMINGRVYGSQEVIQTPQAPKPPFKVVIVLPYKVLLEREGKIIALTYPNGPRTPPEKVTPKDEQDDPAEGEESEKSAAEMLMRQSPASLMGALLGGKLPSTKSGD